MRKAVLAAVAAASASIPACGDDAATGPDAAIEPTGLCTGKPCLTSIDDAADWAAVGMAHARDGRCDFLEDSKFIAPATESAAVQDVVFQDVKVHRLHLDFMTQVLPEHFGGLTPARYTQLVLRRAERQYWAGALFRIVDEDGVTTGYGFDVAVDPAWDEQLTEDEVAAIAARLATRFHLPLVYAPTTGDAIGAAHGFDLTPPPHFPRACQHIRCATAGVDCVRVPGPVSVCGHFWEGREIDVELARKTRVAVVPSTIDLPRAVGNHTVPALFGAGELGPARTPLTPAAATARYEVKQITPQFVQRTYLQTYRVGATPTTIELRWEVPVPADGGGFLFEEPHVSDHFYGYLGPPDATSNDELSQLRSCTAESLERWQVRGALTGGEGSFRIDVRYQPPFAGSGPLFPTGAEVTFGGATTTVDDYFRLVYAGEHHNWNNQYWVLFAPPVTYHGHPVSGLWLDEAAFRTELEAAWTLDAQRRPLDRLSVTGYAFERAP